MNVDPVRSSLRCATPTVPAARSPRRLPHRWPASLRPDRLDALGVATPFLAVDPALVSAKVQALRAALPGVQPFYAVKCNPEPAVLQAVAAAGGSFEIASAGEWEILSALGVDAADVLYSNPVKPAGHIAATAAAGVWRFAVDSAGEVDKVAREAPGAAVHVRVAVDDTDSVFPLSRKFGVTPDRAVDLLRRARARGLQPYGLTFHVGSQCSTPAAWTRAVGSLAGAMSTLAQDGITLTMLDLGGGLPAWYGSAVPGVEEVAEAVERGLRLLPYRPALLAAEPGRHVVAEAAVMVYTVIGRERRGDREWLYLDVGGYHGMIETQQTAGGWEYPLWTSRSAGPAGTVPYVVTGPTCDSADTMFHDVELPADLAEGDRVHIGSTGAYTLSYASSFNGFPPPATVVLR